MVVLLRMRKYDGSAQLAFDFSESYIVFSAPCVGNRVVAQAMFGSLSNLRVAAFE